MNPDQIGVSTASLAGYDLATAIQTIHDMGFGAIELLAFEGAQHSQGPLCGVWFDQRTTRELQELRRQVSDFRFVTTHAPFIDLVLFTHNPGLREESLRQIRVAVEGTAAIGGTLTVVHAHPRHWFTVEESWDEMVTTFRQLGELGAAHGVRVTIETMFPPTVQQFAQLIRDIGHDFVGATVDVGHVAWTVPQELRGKPEGIALYNDNLLALVEALGPRLQHSHLHDVRAADWRDHRAMGRGCVDWERLFTRLRAADYQGALTLELEEPDRQPALRDSYDRLRPLL